MKRLYSPDTAIEIEKGTQLQEVSFVDELKNPKNIVLKYRIYGIVLGYEPEDRKKWIEEVPTHCICYLYVGSKFRCFRFPFRNIVPPKERTIK